VNPGFRLRSTLGYKYFAPSRAWARQSAILISGFYVLVAAGSSVACGDRDIKGDGPWLVCEWLPCRPYRQAQQWNLSRVLIHPEHKEGEHRDSQTTSTQSERMWLLGPTAYITAGRGRLVRAQWGSLVRERPPPTSLG